MRRRAAGWSLTALAVVVVLVLAVPVAADRLPVAQLVAFRAVLGLSLLLSATLLLVVRWTRRRLLALALVLLIGGLAQTVVLVGRERPTAASSPGTSADLVVLSFNTAGRVRPGVIAALALAHRADVLALPETAATTAQASADLLADAGRPMQVFTARSDLPGVDGTALLVSQALGRYRQVTVPDLQLGAAAAAPLGVGPTLMAAHTRAPTGRSVMTQWRDETALAAGACSARRQVLVAGDLNATLDHPALAHLGRCVDAARAAGSGAEGTWPASLPRWLAAPIDHVLLDPTTWSVVAAETLDTADSDHRPLLVTLHRR